MFYPGHRLTLSKVELLVVAHSVAQNWTTGKECSAKFLIT